MIRSDTVFGTVAWCCSICSCLILSSKPELAQFRQLSELTVSDSVVLVPWGYDLVLIILQTVF